MPPADGDGAKPRGEVAKDGETGEPIIAPFILWEPQYVDVTAVEAMQAVQDQVAGCEG